MAERKPTAKQLDTKIETINKTIAGLRERIEKLNADKKELQAQKRKLASAKAAAARKATAGKAAAKKTTAKKTTAKKTATKKTTIRKAPAKKDEGILDGLLEGLKDSGFNAEDILKSILGGDKK